MNLEYYKILGIDHNANAEIIKKAYHNLSRKYHPDKLSESDKDKDGEKFKSIGDAYKVLSDPYKRQIYNKYGKAGLESNMFSAPKKKQELVEPINVTVRLTLEEI